MESKETLGEVESKTEEFHASATPIRLQTLKSHTYEFSVSAASATPLRLQFYITGIYDILLFSYIVATKLSL